MYYRQVKVNSVCVMTDFLLQEKATEAVQTHPSHQIVYTALVYT